MGSYYIPSDKIKGEGRILYIFTGKSLIATAIGAFIGLIFYFLFSALGLTPIGIGIMVIFALIGFGVVTIKIPTAGNTKIEKNVGGETLYQIFLEYMNFRKNKKIYSYSVPRQEPDYASNDMSTQIFDKVLSQTGKIGKKQSTKEENK